MKRVHGEDAGADALSVAIDEAWTIHQRPCCSDRSRDSAYPPKQAKQVTPNTLAFLTRANGPD